MYHVGKRDTFVINTFTEIKKTRTNHLSTSSNCVDCVFFPNSNLILSNVRWFVRRTNTYRTCIAVKIRQLSEHVRFFLQTAVNRILDYIMIYYTMSSSKFNRNKYRPDENTVILLYIAIEIKYTDFISSQSYFNI